MSLTYRKELDLAERDEWADIDTETKAWQDEWERRPDTVTGENDDTYQAALRWRLDKIVMSSSRSMSSVSPRMSNCATRSSTKSPACTSTAGAFGRPAPQSHRSRAGSDELRLQEMTANLDALTVEALKALPSN